MSIYYRPLVQSGAARPKGALSLLGGRLWFTHLEQITRNGGSQVVAAADVDPATLAPFCTPRAPICGLNLQEPVIMGILNATPDSFSDGGQHDQGPAALEAALAMVADGAQIIDIGGESTRPGADFIPPAQETQRTAPLIEALRSHSPVPISIDTRKAEVAQAALGAGASLINDVSGFTFDPDLAPLAAKAGAPVCVMHAQGDPATMQDDPSYDDVLLDVYDFLAQRIEMLETIGVPRGQIIADPGIGFGKTIPHNLRLLENLSLFHGLGVTILLGVSRKGFIGKLGQTPEAHRRAPGSIAVGLAALAQGVQILRVHDVAETAQALRLWQAVQG